MGVILFKWFLVYGFSFFVFHSENSSKEAKLLQVQKLHPFYISVTEITHNDKEKTLEVSCKIFIDDLENTLKKNYNTVVDLSNEKQETQNDKFISDYISKNLLLNADGKVSKCNYIGFEKDGESVYCYFEISNIPTLKKLDVTNSLLQDFTDKQINIMHITVKGKRKSYKLDFPNKQASFSF